MTAGHHWASLSRHWWPTSGSFKLLVSFFCAFSKFLFRISLISRPRMALPGLGSGPANCSASNKWELNHEPLEIGSSSSVIANIRQSSNRLEWNVLELTSVHTRSACGYIGVGPLLSALVLQVAKNSQEPCLGNSRDSETRATREHQAFKFWPFRQTCPIQTRLQTTPKPSKICGLASVASKSAKFRNLPIQRLKKPVFAAHFF